MRIANICSQAYTYSLVQILYVPVILSFCYCLCIFVMLLFCFYSVILLSLLTLPASEHSWVVLTTLACMSRSGARCGCWHGDRSSGSRLLRQLGGVHALSKEGSRSGRLPLGFCEDSAPVSILSSDVMIFFLFCYFVSLVIIL